MKDGFLFFDLDNTILDFSMAERVALSRTLRERGVEPTPERLARYSVINIQWWEGLEEGRLTREQVLVGRFEAFFRELGVALDGAETNARYEGLLHEGHWFMPGAEELLRSLQGRHRVFLVTNGIASVQYSRLASAGVTDCFERIFISEEIGSEKPGRAFFEKCFASIPGFAPERALIVGDSLTSDIRGGINAGIKSCWFNPRALPGRPDIVPDYEIRALSELPALIETM